MGGLVAAAEAVQSYWKGFEYFLLEYPTIRFDSIAQ